MAAAFAFLKERATSSRNFRFESRLDSIILAPVKQHRHRACCKPLNSIRYLKSNDGCLGNYSLTGFRQHCCHYGRPDLACHESLTVTTSYYMRLRHCLSQTYHRDHLSAAHIRYPRMNSLRLCSLHRSTGTHNLYPKVTHFTRLFWARASCRS